MAHHARSINPPTTRTVSMNVNPTQADQKSRSPGFPSISIRYAIPILLIAMITVTVGFTGWLAFRSGQQAVDNLATHLSHETTARIDEHVTAFLNTPHLFGQLNEAAVQAGNMNLDDFPELERFFWHQVHVTESVPFIYFGSEDGTFIGVQKDRNDELFLWIDDESTGGTLDVHRLDEQLNPIEMVDSVEFDPRVRPWYQAAVQAGGPTWSPVYTDIARPILIITPAVPIYDDEGLLRGVLGIELSLSEISDFLNTLTVGRAGQAYIIEPNGNIIASSSSEPPFFMTDDGPQRLNATQSSEPSIQASAQYLVETFGSIDQIEDEQQIVFDLDGERQYTRIVPLDDGRGLEWLIVVVIPESDFMEPIYANTRTTVLLSLGILVVVTVLGLRLARWIIQPVFAVMDTAAAIEAGNFNAESLDPIGKRQDEFGQLARVFQNMAQEVYTREQRLKQEVQKLRIEIDEVKRQQQVDAIVETDFFRDLEAKARTMRERGKKEDSDE
jgi:HAMP domain-containing protein